MLDFHVISLSQTISPSDNSGSGFLLAIFQEYWKWRQGKKIHKMMLEEERNVAALEKIKPRQLVLPAHVPLASNPFIATARKSKMAETEKRLLSSSVGQGQQLHWQAAGLCCPRTVILDLFCPCISEHRGIQKSENIAKKSLPTFMSAHLNLWAWHHAQIPARILQEIRRFIPSPSAHSWEH